MIAKLILLGTLTVTSYRPIAEQTKPECTNRFHCTTSIDDGITKFGIAVSQDLLRSGKIHYGDVLYIEGYGSKIVNDTMASYHKNAVDILVFTHNEEKLIGVRHLKVYKIAYEERK